MSRISKRLLVLIAIFGVATWIRTTWAAPPGLQRIPIDDSDDGEEDDGGDPLGDPLYPYDVPDSIFATSDEAFMAQFDLEHPNQRVSTRPYSRTGRSLRTDDVVQSDGAATHTIGHGGNPTDVNAPALSGNFAGMTDNNTFFPPDTTGAVGPSNVFEFLNTGRVIYDKTGAVTNALISFQSFWSALGTGSGLPAENVSDPRVLWDQYTNRWIVSAIGFGGNQWVLLGISTTSSPAGPYNLFGVKLNVNTNGFDHTTDSIDFDLTGFDPNNVITTVNIFSSAGAFVHSDAYVVSKAKLIAGGTLAYGTDFTIFHDPCGEAGTLTNINFAPCVTFGQTPATAVNYLIDNGWYDVSDFTVRYFRVSTITGTGAAATLDCMSDNNFLVTSGCYNFGLLSASQPSGCTAISTNDIRISSPATVRNGKIWFTHPVGKDVAGCPDPATVSTGGKSELIWVQADPATLPNPMPPPPVQSGRISDSVQAYYFPSIAVNSCEGVMVGFTGSGPNAGQFASGLYTGRLATDPANTMQSVAAIKTGVDTYRKVQGTGINARNRWGDYSATCVDPADDSTLWSVQEYANTHVGTACANGTGRWATWWGKMPIACCPVININPGSLPGATIAVPYNQALTPSAGTPAFTFVVQSGSLPPGLSLSGAGVISGTASSTVGVFNFTVKVTDANGCTGTQNYSISVTCALPGDVNNDGIVNGLDIQHFVNCALGGSSPGGNCGCADMDTNGSVNDLDIPAFVTALGV